MNLYAIIILATIAISFLLSLLGTWLNLRSMRSELPDEFAENYSAEKYKTSQEYTRTKSSFGMISETFSTAALLIFWFSGGFNLVDVWLRDFNFSPLVTGLLYIVVLMLGKGVLDLPFSIYHTFVIEERFGFNRTTPATFISDLIKGVILGVLIGGPLLGALLYFFEFFGSLAWLYAWGAITVFSIFMQYIAPTWILPLFNKFTPLTEGELRDSIMNYARSVNYPLQNIFVMDGSKRSSKSNATFGGFGKNKRISLFDTLIEQHSTTELTAILAHEIGHYKKKHILQSMLISFAHSGVMFFLLSFFLSQSGLFEAFYMEQPSLYAGLIFFGMLFSPIELILSIFMNILSRKNEYEADRYAVETFPHPDDFISALKKLATNNLSNLTPHPFYVFLNYSHPPLLERIAAIQRI